MRFRREKYLDDFTRQKTRFLLLPKKINGEVRWLEKASWMELMRYTPLGPVWDKEYWLDEQ